MVEERQVSEASYQAESIQVLDPIDHFRKRPGLYIGDVSQRGLYHVVFQLVVNSLAECAEGFGRSIEVTLGSDGSIKITDEGRGIDGTPPPGFKLPLLQLLLTHLFTGARPSGREWADYTIANALSEWFQIESRHEGKMYRQEFRRGQPVASVQEPTLCSGSGIQITFRPDPAIFPDPHVSFGIIRDRLHTYACLNSGVRILLTDDTIGAKELFQFVDGIREFVRLLNSERRPLHSDILVVRGEREGVQYEVGLQWCQEAKTIMRSFVNNEETIIGSHITGFLSAVTRSLNSFIRRKQISNHRKLNGKEVQRGLTAMISVRMAQPIFSGSTKARLDNEEARRAVGSGVYRFLKDTFQADPALVETVVRMATSG